MTDQITRTETGLVVSSSRDKTITVIIERTIKHPLYKKILRRSTKLHAHDQDNQCEEGDLVTIKECKPLSKTKSWNLVSIDKKGQSTEISTTGRHDPCVGIRATPIAEAMLAVTLMDHALRNRAQNADVVSVTPPVPASKQ